MKRLPLLTCVVALAFVGVLATSAASAGATLCVGGSACFATVQEAVDAARDGDTITIGPGTFAGGSTNDVSVNPGGSGTRRKNDTGGGPGGPDGQGRGDTGAPGSRA